MAATNGVNGVNGVNGHHESAHVAVEDFIKQEYDYLIVGGGTAGLCIAARLTENPNVTVGVIEAGKNRLGDMFVDTPALFLAMLGNKDYDYFYLTTPQDGNKGTVHHVPRGKLLGGSSGINYMMYVRGSLQDYDDWAELAEDPSWSAAKMKHYMRKHQTLEPMDQSITDRSNYPFVGENHGTDGPVRTSFNDNALPIDTDVIKAADEACGFSKKPVDPWSGDHIGFYNTLGIVARSGPNKGKRAYAARGYFQANAHRPNLKVITESTVAKVLLDNQTATGVEFIYDGQHHQVKAKREVIVCGGCIASPQILELSGIGNPEVLRAAGVEPLVNLPSVGNDFQDHQLVITTWQLNPDQMSGDSMHKPEIMAMAQKALAENQGGPLTSISSVQGFYPATLFLDPDEVSEIEQIINNTKTESEFQRKQLQQVLAQIKSPTSANMQFVFVPATADQTGVSDQSHIFPPPPPNQPDGITLAICLQYGASRGYVHIKSNDPFAHPEINPRYLTNEADVILLAAGLKMLEKLTAAPSLKDKLAKRVHPAPEVDLEDRKQRRDTVRDWVLGEYHVAGGCAMGHTVDSRLRVKGVQGLRVADASTFANHVSGNIVSSVYAIAEKAADMIKEDMK